jgi:hypothetical protein
MTAAPLVAAVLPPTTSPRARDARRRRKRGAGLLALLLVATEPVQAEVAHATAADVRTSDGGVDHDPRCAWLSSSPN